MIPGLTMFGLIALVIGAYNPDVGNAVLSRSGSVMFPLFNLLYPVARRFADSWFERSNTTAAGIFAGVPVVYSSRALKSGVIWLLSVPIAAYSVLRPKTT